VLEVWARQLGVSSAALLTSREMTRFVITAEQAVQFVLDAVYDAEGGEIFVPVLPAARIADLFIAFYSTIHPIVDMAELFETGLRPGGEKLHERLLTAEEGRHRLAAAGEDRYAVLPTHREWTVEPYPYKPVELTEPYDSEHARRLTCAELVAMLGSL